MSELPVHEHKEGKAAKGDSRKRRRDEEAKDEAVLAHESRAKRPRVDDDDEKILKRLKACLASGTLQMAHTKLKTLKLDGTMQIKEHRPDGSLLVDVQRKNDKDHHCSHGGPCSLLVHS
jgi:hypothetical protein